MKKSIYLLAVLFVAISCHLPSETFSDNVYDNGDINYKKVNSNKGYSDYIKNQEENYEVDVNSSSTYTDTDSEFEDTKTTYANSVYTDDCGGFDEHYCFFHQRFHGNNYLTYWCDFGVYNNCYGINRNLTSGFNSFDTYGAVGMSSAYPYYGWYYGYPSSSYVLYGNQIYANAPGYGSMGYAPYEYPWLIGNNNNNQNNTTTGSQNTHYGPRPGYTSGGTSTNTTSYPETVKTTNSSFNKPSTTSIGTGKVITNNGLNKPNNNLSSEEVSTNTVNKPNNNSSNTTSYSKNITSKPAKNNWNKPVSTNVGKTKPTSSTGTYSKGNAQPYTNKYNTGHTNTNNSKPNNTGTTHVRTENSTSRRAQTNSGTTTSGPRSSSGSSSSESKSSGGSSSGGSSRR